MRHEAMRAQGLEAELRVVSAAEQRASRELSALSSDKFRLAAELEAARAAHAEREGELLRELGKLKEEVRTASAAAGWGRGSAAVVSWAGSGSCFGGEVGWDCWSPLRKLERPARLPCAPLLPHGSGLGAARRPLLVYRSLEKLLVGRWPLAALPAQPAACAFQRSAARIWPGAPLQLSHLAC